MNWKGCGKKQSWPNLRYCPGTGGTELYSTLKDALYYFYLGQYFYNSASARISVKKQ
jgi:hypothetical protein